MKPTAARVVKKAVRCIDNHLIKTPRPPGAATDLAPAEPTVCACELLIPRVVVLRHRGRRVRVDVRGLAGQGVDGPRGLLDVVI
jgi:hypothetical protein